jgi:TPR repeat protein
MMQVPSLVCHSRFHEDHGKKIRIASAILIPMALTACAHPNLADALNCRPELTSVALTPSSAYWQNSIDDLKSLASSGDKVAARVLGERYQFGDGGPVDLRKAAQWYERAAFIPPTTSFVYMPGFGKTPGAQVPVTVGQTGPGDPIALGRLGLLYRTGQGVKADPARADALLFCATTRNVAKFD